MNLSLLLLLLSLAYSGCSKEPLTPSSGVRTNSFPEGHIVGGSLLDYGSDLASRVVFISSTKPNGYPQICTGTFISEQLILTAKHCIASTKYAMSVEFRPTTFEKNNNRIDLPIVEVFNIDSDPDLNINRQDLALILYSGGLPKGAKTTDLAADLAPNDTKRLISVGYGKSNGRTNLKPMTDTGEGSLRSKAMNAKSVLFTSDLFILNQVRNKGGVCDGDSGGPSFVLNTRQNQIQIIGVASALEPTSKKDECLSRSVFMNMIFYKQHIHLCAETINHASFEENNGKARKLVISSSSCDMRAEKELTN